MFCTILLFIIGVAHLGGSAEINPDLYNNKINFPYGINYKYNGKVTHNLDRIWVVTKVQLPDFKHLLHQHDDWKVDCEFINDINRTFTKQFVVDFRMTKIDNMSRTILETLNLMCTEIQPLLRFLKTKNRVLRTSAVELIETEVFEHYPQLRTELLGQRPKRRRKPRGIMSMLLPAVPALSKLAVYAVEGIASLLSKKRDRAVNLGMQALYNQGFAVPRNILYEMANERIMFGKYDIGQTQEILDTMRQMARRTELERIMAEREKPEWLLKVLRTTMGPVVLSNRLQLLLWTKYEKTTALYEKLILSLKEIRQGLNTLSKGELPAEFFSSARIRSIVKQVRSMVRANYPEYTVALTHPQQYYDMKLVTFGIDENDHELVVTFPVFITNHNNKELTLYELETVPVPILDRNVSANSYTQVKVTKPYIAISNDYYIQLRMQELRMCKTIKLKFYCEELFLVKHKTKHSCESALFFDLDENIIKRNCDFEYTFNKTVIPSVLDGGKKIVLANMLESKHLTCKKNMNLAKPFKGSDYVMVNRSLLCNCQMDSGLTYLLRSLGSCTPDQVNKTSHMKFTINMAFYNYFKEIMDASKKLDIDTNLTDKAVTFPIDLSPVYLDTETGLIEPDTLKEWTLAMTARKQESTKAKIKRTAISIVKIMAIVAITITGTALLGIGYYICKQKKLHGMVATLTMAEYQRSLAAEAAPVGKAVVCSDPELTYFLTAVTIVGILIYLYKHYKAMTCLRGEKLSNAATVYLILCDNCHYVKLKLLEIPRNITLCTQQGQFGRQNIEYIERGIWDTVKFDFKKYKFLYDEEQVFLPRVVAVPLTDKIKARRMAKQETCCAYIRVRQNNTWYAPTVKT